MAAAGADLLKYGKMNAMGCMESQSLLSPSRMTHAFVATHLHKAAAASVDRRDIWITARMACSIDAGVGGGMPSDLYLDKMLHKITV
jgi:hypothetical protein